VHVVPPASSEKEPTVPLFARLVASVIVGTLYPLVEDVSVILISVPGVAPGSNFNSTDLKTALVVKPSTTKLELAVILPST